MDESHYIIGIVWKKDDKFIYKKMVIVNAGELDPNKYVEDLTIELDKQMKEKDIKVKLEVFKFKLDFKHMIPFDYTDYALFKRPIPSNNTIISLLFPLLSNKSGSKWVHA